MSTVPSNSSNSAEAQTLALMDQIDQGLVGRLSEEEIIHDLSTNIDMIDLTYRNSHCLTALDCAVLSGHSIVAGMLIEEIAESSDIDPDEKVKILADARSAIRSLATISDATDMASNITRVILSLERQGAKSAHATDFAKAVNFNLDVDDLVAEFTGEKIFPPKFSMN